MTVVRSEHFGPYRGRWPSAPVAGLARWSIALAVVLGCATTPAYAAGAEMPALVRDIGMSLFLSGALAIIFARVRFPAIAGYILAGVVAGPLGLKLITDPDNIETIAELGFVLLLFVIGLEIDIGKIVRSGRAIVVTGILAFPLSVLFGFGIAKLLAIVGFGAFLGDGLGPLYVGLALACSSTLLVVKLFQENFELDTVPGRVALGLLIFEDLWAIVAIALQPSIDSPELSPVAFSFTGIAVLGAIAFVLSRQLIPIVFRWIAKVPEIILVGAISWCFAVIFLGLTMDPITEALFGVNLHLNVGAGMGALIAGATIASLPYSTEIVTKVSVVKDFFITLFFVGLGLDLNVPSGPTVLILTVIIAIAAIAARQLIVFPLLYFSGLDQRNAEVTALRIAQISELGLVITFIGFNLGHLSDNLRDAIVLAFVLTALVTPFLYSSAYRIHAALSPLLTALGFGTPPVVTGDEDTPWRLVLLGFHRVASSILYDIARDDPDLLKETMVVDYNVELHHRIRDIGAHVEYGDIANAETLRHAGINRAEVVVLTIPDDLMRGTDNARLVANVRRINPKAIIIANAVGFADCDAIYAAGADYVFLARLETARAVGEAIGNALNGDIKSYRERRESAEGKPSERTELLR
jgi:Kef-type K+ transport system membrane component KefB